MTTEAQSKETQPCVTLAPNGTDCYIAHSHLCCIWFRMLMEEGTDELQIAYSASTAYQKAKADTPGEGRGNKSGNIQYGPLRVDCLHVV